MQRIGAFQGRALFWSWYTPRNFGDWIGPYLFEAISGQVPIFTNKNSKAVSSCNYFVGSILRKIERDNWAVVWGSGIISKGDNISKPKDVLCVRGPRSRDRLLELGYDCPEIYGDPAVLLPVFYEPKSAKNRFSLGVIPHFFDFDLVEKKLSTANGVLIVDVSGDVESVVDQIASCDFTISSSLHGIIVSHAYGVPSAWLQSIRKLEGDDVKFLDYFNSVGISNPKFIKENSLWALNVSELRAFATLPDQSELRKNLKKTCPIGKII